MRCSSCNAPMEIVVTPEQRKYVCTVCGKEVPCPNEQLEVNHDDGDDNDYANEEYLNRVRVYGRRYEAIRRREEKRNKMIMTAVLAVLVVSFVLVLYTSLGENAELVEESDEGTQAVIYTITEVIPFIGIVAIIGLMLGMLRSNIYS